MNDQRQGVAILFRQEGALSQQKEMSVRYYISLAKLTAKQLAQVIRAYWQIEVQQHWILDVGMLEDEFSRRKPCREEFTDK